MHHTAESNTYTCADAPQVVRGIYAYHVKQLGWKDSGHNFPVDKCGTVYEGRKGGVDRPVQGAHAYGFNAETTGVPVLGTYTDAAPSRAALTSVARIAVWKLGQYGVNPAGTATLTAGDRRTDYFHHRRPGHPLLEGGRRPRVEGGAADRTGGQDLRAHRDRRGPHRRRRDRYGVGHDRVRPRGQHGRRLGLVDAGDPPGVDR
ncbi:N-acetylmuramoyl-L-alanine amidase [Streptomyces sp. NPDC012769]|uniref:N-acetylmuramoyl-L-alanine amidase n=1 Tax=Streptomyces sp. NPDC012769 TaxID=3364848 RepID=UPI0036761D43